MNLSERELGRKAQLSPGTVNVVLSGQKDIRLSTVFALAEGLEVPAFYLLMSEREREQWDSMQTVEPKTFAERLTRLERSVLTSKSEELFQTAEHMAENLLSDVTQKKKKSVK